MPHAISLKCLNNSASPIVELWREAATFEEVPSMRALNYPAHITLAVYDDIEPDRVASALHKVFHGHPPLTVAFDKIHFFRNDFLVFWARPASDELLRRVHAALHAEVDPALCHEHYRPGHWVPHCTIAMRIPHAASAAAIGWAGERRPEFSVIFDAVDCLRFHPVEVISEIRLAE